MLSWKELVSKFQAQTLDVVITVGDEIGYYDRSSALLIAGVVVKKDDTVITFKPYKFKEQEECREYPGCFLSVTFIHWMKDDFDGDITFDVEKTNSDDYGFLEQINEHYGLDYWCTPPVMTFKNNI
jgi:hypothetical protein